MRDKARIAGFVGGAVLLCCSISYAEPILVTFDERSPGAYGPTLYQSIGLELYSFSCSIEFDCDSPRVNVATVFHIDASTSATTPPNAAFGDSPGFSGLYGIFLDTRRPTGPPLQAATTFLSFSVVNTSPGQTAPWRVAIYGPGHELLEARTGTSDQHVVFSRTSNDIRYFRLFPPAAQRVGIDTLEFNSPVIPEPGTLILLAGGLVGMAARRLRRSRSVKD